MKFPYFLVLIVLTFVSSISSNAQKYEQKPPAKTRILFVLDASGSMLGSWDNGQQKIKVAKQILSDLIDSLKVNNNLELALRVYGHQYDRRLKVCTDSKLEVAFRPDNHQDIIFKLRSLQPKGNTPIAYSLEQTPKDFPADKNVRNVVIIITDGIESCDGDPCAVSLALQSKNILLKPFVIGLGLNASYSANFSCMGRFFDASNVDGFRGALDEVLKQTLQKTTVSIELLDHLGAKKVTNLNVTFSNRNTKQPVYDFVHYRDKAGRPDSVEIDAVLDYDLTVYSVPPISKKNIKIKGGRHNVIAVSVPQGALSLSMKGLSEYGRKVPVLIRPTGKTTILNKQDFKESSKYLAGKYDVEIFTLPKTIISGYALRPGRNNTIQLPQPGVVNFVFGSKGFGSLYKMGSNGQEWFHNFDYNQTQWTSDMQPGNYKLVYRANFAYGRKYTKVKLFEVTSGSTQTVNINR